MFATDVASAAQISDAGFGPVVEAASGATGCSSGRKLEKRKRAGSGSVSEASQDRKKSKHSNKLKKKVNPTEKAGAAPKGAANAKKADFKRADGRYVRDAKGVEICFSFARHAGGCKESCPQGRTHICEWCREEHRSIDCSSKPRDWKP